MNRTLRTCFLTGGAGRGGVAGLDAVGEDVAGRWDTTRRVSRGSDGEPDDSLRALFGRLLLVGDGDLSDGVDAPDSISVVSSSESLSTNSHDLYMTLRPVVWLGFQLLTCSISTAVACVPSGRQLCCMIRWRRWFLR